MITKTGIKRDMSVAIRCKKVGDVGEELTESLLANNGFVNIQDLNRLKINYPYADFYAERDNEKYVISVKTRNKYEFRHDGKLRINPRYKLGSKCYENASLAEDQFKAKAAWITIAIDAQTLSAYFGLLSSLTSRGVPMNDEATSNYECLAKDMPHAYDYDSLRNVYEIR